MPFILKFVVKISSMYFKPNYIHVKHFKYRHIAAEFYIQYMIGSSLKLAYKCFCRAACGRLSIGGLLFILLQAS